MSEPAAKNTSWWDSAKRAFNHNVTGSLGKTTNDAADWIQKATKDNISATHVKQAAPIVAAASVATTGMLMKPAVEKMGQSVFRGARWLVTGGGGEKKKGFFEKIPVLGAVFGAAGSVMSKIGDYSGYIAPATGSFFAYHAFKSAASPPSGDPKRMPNSGTGATPQEPVTGKADVYRPGTNIHIGGVTVIESPKPVKDSPQAAGNPALREAEYARLREIRVQALGANDARRSELLRAIMADKNQRYENRRLFLTRVNEFATVRQANINATPRDHLISLISRDDVGLTPEEAARLVPTLDGLRSTVTPGTNATTNSVAANGQPTDFGGKYGKLVEFAERIEKFYGVRYFEVSQRLEGGATEKVRLAFKEMSVTQQQEFVEKALEHCRTKMEWFNNNCIRTESRTGSLGIGHTGYTTTRTVEDFGKPPYRERTRWERFRDTKKPEGSDTYLDAEGAPVVRKWSEHYRFLSALNGDGKKIEINRFGSTRVTVPGTGIAGATGMFSEWQNLLDAHRIELRNAEQNYNGKIAQYVTSIAFMQNSLAMIRHHSVAPLTYGSYADRAATTSPLHNQRDYISVRDLRNATGGNRSDAQLIRLEGEWMAAGDRKNWKFVVRGISSSTDPTKRMTLEQPVTLDLANSDGMNQLKPQMDRFHQLQRTAALATQPVRTSQADIPADPNQELADMRGENVEDGTAVTPSQTGNNRRDPSLPDITSV